MTKIGILFSYDTKRKKFDSLYERNKFYRGLFGYKQTVKENGKVYKYEKKGLVNEIPHIKVEDSVVIVLKKDADRFREYLEKWSNKVDYRCFKVLLKKCDKEELQNSAEKMRQD